MVKEYGYEYDAKFNFELWSKTQHKVTNRKLGGAYCLRSGRDALKIIAREFSPCIVMLPALACDSMILPFKMYGHKVKYYRLNADYSINLQDVLHNMSDQKTLFLYMDYFGCNSIDDSELQHIRNLYSNVVFLEDRTHNLIWENHSTFKPDYVIASLRKWLPIPDGGLLWGDVTGTIGSDTSFSERRLYAQCLRNEFLRNGNEATKEKYRNIFSHVADIIDKDEKPSSMSAYTYGLIQNFNWDVVRLIRKNNAKKLISILGKSKNIHLIQNKSGVSDLYVGFMVEKRDEIQRKLSLEGIFCTIIWPLNDRQKKYCPVAKYTEEHMLAAPCDQRYTIEDMELIGREIIKVVENVNK